MSGQPPNSARSMAIHALLLQSTESCLWLANPENRNCPEPTYQLSDYWHPTKRKYIQHACLSAQGKIKETPKHKFAYNLLHLLLVRQFGLGPQRSTTERCCSGQQRHAQVLGNLKYPGKTFRLLRCPARADWRHAVARLLLIAMRESCVGLVRTCTNAKS